MQQKKKLITAAVTVSAIVGAAHLMQRDGSVSALVLDSADPEIVSLTSVMPAKALAPGAIEDADIVKAVVDVPGAVAPDSELPGADLVAQDMAAAADRPAPVVIVAAPVSTPDAAPETAETALPETAGDAPDPLPTAPEVDLALLDESAKGPGPLSPAPLTEPIMPQEAEAPAPLPLPSRDMDERSRVAAVEQVPNDASAPRDLNEYGLACDVIATASTKPSAMVRLTVTAPCRAGERITVRHEGLLYSARIDGLGTYSADVPALVGDAGFTITFPDGASAETRTEVTLADEIERVALQYNGKTGLQIHALEFGAEYGDAGHIWNGHPSNAEAALKLGGGYMTVLGDASLEFPFMAEVYTLPSDATSRDGVVRLSVEAEVTADNCGRDVAGQTMQKRADGTMTPVSLTLSMPDCDAKGEFLVLKNLLRDLKIASN